MEELSLRLVLERENRTLPDCAKEAVQLLRDSDNSREYGEMLQALVQVYQKHNGSLASYGTAIEECFESAGKPRSAENDTELDTMELVRDALDYRKWFEFQRME